MDDYYIPEKKVKEKNETDEPSFIIGKV